jgi:hypothetical protein
MDVGLPATVALNPCAGQPVQRLVFDPWEPLQTASIRMRYIRNVKNRKRPSNGEKAPSLQEFFFKEALTEQGLSAANIEIDHYLGQCWSDETGWIPLVFPLRVTEFTERLDKTRTQKYFFAGMINSGREWLANYPGVRQSGYGRDKDKKYDLDLSYYSGLSKSEFGLSPVGDCPWSYRFFEAIMCGCLPIIGSRDRDIFAHHFNFRRDGDCHAYDVELASSNYDKFLTEHTLRKSS